jgi:hypothetical protein
MAAGAATVRWSRREVVALAGVVLAGILVRAVLLPTDGFRPDLDQFVLWVHGIAVNGLGHAYDQNLTFGPVMAGIWGMLAALEPAFRTATDASDPTIRVLMKLPATLADFGLAALVAYALRERPRWAVLGAGAILLHPAVIDVSAWWGQYESIYVLWGVAAVVCAVGGRNVLAAGFVTLAIMTKPQALPFILPFAAWFWVRGGARGLITCAAMGLAVIVVLWLPFAAAGGPANYLHNLAFYQQEVFPVLSLRAWNLWWIVQDGLAGGQFVNDQAALIGPLTGRYLGYGLTVALSVVVAGCIVRDPRPRTLVLGLTVATLSAFCFLTAMHERYAYGAVILLTLLLPDRRFHWLALALGAASTLNLVAAIPPTPAIGEHVRIGGILGIVGSLAMLVLTGFLLWWLIRESHDHRAAEGSFDRGLSLPP